jgi:predicted secreted protein
MEKKEDILLQNHFTNNMKINGELGWFSRDYNASTGYSWQYRPDDSGVYELVEEVILHPSTNAVGVAGMIIWKFKAVRAGKGNVLFELYPPSGIVPVETITIEIQVIN